MRHLFVGFPRITVDPKVMTGKPCIRGMRVTVGMIVGNVRAGVSIDRLLELYPYVEREDVLESLRFVGQLDRETEAKLLGEVYGSTDPADIGDQVLRALRNVEPDLSPSSIVIVDSDRAHSQRDLATVPPTDQDHG